MTRRAETIGSSYFDALYQAEEDPWRFRTSAYERGKYDATLEALGTRRYGHALEIGCAIGVLTRDLAARCGMLLAVDGSEVALQVARRDCAGLSNVDFTRGMVPTDFPAGTFDLIVLSEVLYYLAPADLDAVAARCLRALAADGVIVLCHWLGETDYPLTGQQATERFLQATASAPLTHTCLEADVYRLDRLTRRSAAAGAEPPPG